MSADISPFELVETGTGKFSLLLTEFDPASEAFEDADQEGAGYSWDAVARHVVENVVPALEDRVEFDSESSTFCAYSEDREALATLGIRLVRLFRDHRALTEIIAAIGPHGFGA